MDVNFDIIGVGRRPTDVTAVLVREVTPADMALRAAAKELPTTKPTALKRISQRHHSLARLLAAGEKPSNAAAMTGYSAVTVSILQTDPAFQELVAFYGERVAAEYVGLHEKMAGLAVDAVDELSERLETAPEKIGTSTLVDILTATADRTGHGPSSQSLQVNVNIGMADRVRAAREKAMNVARGRVEIDGEVRKVG